MVCDALPRWRRPPPLVRGGLRTWRWHVHLRGESDHDAPLSGVYHDDRWARTADAGVGGGAGVCRRAGAYGGMAVDASRSISQPAPGLPGSGCRQGAVVRQSARDFLDVLQSGLPVSVRRFSPHELDENGRAVSVGVFGVHSSGCLPVVAGAEQRARPMHPRRIPHGAVGDGDLWPSGDQSRSQCHPVRRAGRGVWGDGAAVGASAVDPVPDQGPHAERGPAVWLRLCRLHDRVSNAFSALVRGRRAGGDRRHSRPRPERAGISRWPNADGALLAILCPGHGTTALVDRPTYYDAHDFKPSEAPAGALLACAHGDLVCRALGDRGDWRRISSRTEPDATTSFEVFEKTHPDQ